MSKMLSRIDANIDIEKSRFRGRPSTKEILELVARKGSKGGGKFPPGGVGGSEERKNSRKKERKKRRNEERKKGIFEDF